MIPRRKPRFYRGQLFDIARFFLSSKACQGEYIEAFEKRFAEYIGCKFAIATPSGKKGMELLLEACNLQKGDEIIIPAYTLKALVDLIKRKGFAAKLADIDEGSFNISPQSIEALISPGTKVILATHLFGLPCNLRDIERIAEKYNLKVIEDCAHAAGSKYENKKVGSGNDSFFSLEFIKNLNTFGGGVVTTNDGQTADFIRKRISKLPFSRASLFKRVLFCYLEYFLTVTPFFYLFTFLFSFKASADLIDRFYLFLSHKARAGEYRFTNLQAFIGLKLLARLDKANEMRRKNAGSLSKYLKGSKYLALQDDALANSGRTYYYYVIRILSNSVNLYRLRRRLMFQGVDCGIYSEITNNCAIGLNGNYLSVNKVYANAMQLPIFDNMRESHIKKISRALSELSDVLER